MPPENEEEVTVKRTLLVVSAAMVGLGVVVMAGSAGGSDAMDYWPTWRGPLYSGVAPNGDPPVKWSETKNIRWKVKLPGPGHSTPVVWGDRIYVLSAVDTGAEAASEPSEPGGSSGSLESPPTPAAIPASYQEGQQPPPDKGQRPDDRRGRKGPPPKAETPKTPHRFVVSALDRRTGETVWETVVREEVPHESGHVTASQASGSPVTDGEHIWAFFGSRGLYCLDRNGKVKWEQDLGEMRTRNEFGEGASPVLSGDLIVINWDHEGDSFIAAFDKATGKQRWKVPRDEPTSWTTPLVIDDNGRDLAVVSGANRVRAYDVKTGKEVWQCGGLGLNCVPAPVEAGGMLFVMSGYREAAGMAIRYAGAEGDITDGDAVAWKIDRGLSYVPSPVLYDGKLYFLQRFSGVLSCYDLKTGKAVYTEQRLEGMGNIYASLVGAAGRIYVLARDGKAVVFRHGEKFELLATNELDDAFDASPVIVGEDLYLRGHEYLYAVAEVAASVD
jgi:outer membrane protein assembly factor BamB